MTHHKTYHKFITLLNFSLKTRWHQKLESVMLKLMNGSCYEISEILMMALCTHTNARFAILCCYAGIALLPYHAPTQTPLRQPVTYFPRFSASCSSWPLVDVLRQKWCHRSFLRPRFCIGGPLKFFVYLSPFKSYSSVLIWLEIWHPGSKISGFWGFWLRDVISYQCDPQKALPYSKSRRLSYRANRLSRFCCRGLQEKM
jgi:hypothetical protein